MSEWCNTTMKGIPKSEEVCVWHYNEGGSELLFATTRDYKGMYKLYSIDNGVAIFTKKKSKNPLDFNEYIDKGIEKRNKHQKYNKQNKE